MSHEDDLVRAAAVHRFARECHERADELRVAAIRAARNEGGMTVRAIAELVELGRTRVVAILGEGPAAPERTAMDEAMRVVLARHGGWMPLRALAGAIENEGLYRRRDGTAAPANQVRARASKNPEVFELTTDGSGQIRLR